LSPTQASAASSSRLPPAPPLARRTSSPTQVSAALQCCRNAARSKIAQNPPQLMARSPPRSRTSIIQSSALVQGSFSLSTPYTCTSVARTFPSKIYFGHFPRQVFRFSVPMLFAVGCQKFTTPEITAYLGFSTMSENYHRWFDAGWLQHQVKDGMSHLTATEAKMLAGKDSLADNEDYVPYGRTEMQDDEPAAAPPSAASPGSASTVSDDGHLESPSLGTHCFVVGSVHSKRQDAWADIYNMISQEWA